MIHGTFICMYYCFVYNESRTKEVHVRFLQRLESAALPSGHEPLYLEQQKCHILLYLMHKKNTKYVYLEIQANLQISS